MSGMFSHGGTHHKNWHNRAVGDTFEVVSRPDGAHEIRTTYRVLEIESYQAKVEIVSCTIATDYLE